jgi:hypothetical protein
VAEPHLWEIDHPYYATTGSFFSRERHIQHESWAAFMAAWGDSDPDMNLLYRWDWQSWKRHPDPDLRSDSPDELELFFVLQRRADLWSHGVAITDEDEPAVREWLAERAKTITAIWEPISLAAAEAVASDG